MVEARSSTGDFYGEERLVSLIKELRQVSAKECLQVVFNAVMDFTGGRLVDDLALLAVSIKRD